MADCTPGFTETAQTLGRIDCAHAPAIVSWRSPADLANGTLPVIEVVMLVAAVAALVHAVLWWRRRGDPTNLGLWCAMLVYVVVLEPPLYFPDRFGLQDQIGLIFVHNLFSVQFLYDRLPLYIVAVYPALTYPAYALIQRAGTLSRHGLLAGAACVAFAFHCLYEVFDALGPQLRWWAWNPEAPTNTPMLTAVPLTSVAIFAAASPFGIAVLTGRLLARRAAAGPIPPVSFVARVVAIGVFAPLFMVLGAVPYGVLSRLPDRSAAAEAVALWAVVVAIAVTAVVTLVRDLRRAPGGRAPGGRAPGGRPPGADAGQRPPDRFVDGFPVVAMAGLLLALGGLWLTALPDYLGALDGRTTAGTPVGSLAYTLACAVGVAGLIAVTLVTVRRSRRMTEHRVAGGRVAGRRVAGRRVAGRRVAGD